MLSRKEYAGKVENHRSTRMMRGDDRSHDEVARPLILPAIEHMCAAEPISRRELIAANGLLADRRAGALRKTPMWVGGAHPAESWFVAPDAAMLPKLLADLASFLSDLSLPVTLRAAVGLVRFLQIHPFKDANGRTSRALFLAICLREFGHRESPLGVLPNIWRTGGLHLHAASLSIRDHNNWEPYLDLAHSSFALALGQTP
ncbi:Fic family protein [Pseudoxanthomonas sp. CAU 1598]|uniref:Fic family protein n=2 Tax=Pseudomarimonas arenosa TaxID=2774145 RepID=A0AAW3ZK86_9GAMM|nr:Fic family protein [Pseudomarimonas arenosa]